MYDPEEHPEYPDGPDAPDVLGFCVGCQAVKYGAVARATPTTLTLCEPCFDQWCVEAEDAAEEAREREERP